MEIFDNEVFGFGDEINNELEQTNQFNYNSTDELGEDSYENKDVFNTEVENSNYDYNEDVKVWNDNQVNINNNVETNINLNPFEEYDVSSKTTNESLENDNSFKLDNSVEKNFNVDENVFSIEEPVASEHISDEGISTDVDSQSEKFNNQENQLEDSTNVSFNDTPIEELNKLTEYAEDKIDSTDINELFDRVSVNVQDASEIFKKNTDLKQKIDVRFEELKKLQNDLENSKQRQLDEINNYKDEVLEKLTSKKEEIERRLNLLKETQATLEQEKNEFEQYKNEQQEKIDKVQKDVQSAYDDRREELNEIEDKLRKQKDALDEERNQLSLDKIQYEADKNDLANNLLKFNELVNSFTNGVNNMGE